MSDSKRTRRLDDALVTLGLIAAYFALGGLHYSLGAGVVFVALCFEVGRRIDPSALALVPLLVVPVGVYPLGTGLLLFVLLLLGPLLLHFLIGAIAVALQMLWRSEAGMDRIALIQLLSTPAWSGLILACAVVALLESGPLGLLFIVLPALFIWRKHLLLAAAAAAAAAALSGWSLAPLILTGTLVALLVWRISARPPILWHPFPAVAWKRQPLTWLRIRRCDRRIERGDFLRARSTVEAGEPPGDHQLLRLAFLDIEERSYQRALSLTVGSEDPTGELGRAAALLRGRALSGVAQFEAAGAIYQALLDEHPERDRFVTYMLVLQAENSVAAGAVSIAREQAERAHAHANEPGEYFLRLRASSVLAECALEVDDDAIGFEARIEVASNDMLAGNRWVSGLALQSDSSRGVRQLFGRQGNLHLHFVRIEALTHRGEPGNESGWDAEAVAMAMAISGWSDQMVELLLIEADVAARAGREDERLRLGIRALMELDATRYRLAAQSARTSWSRRLQRALAVTLDAAAGMNEHALVAELLEFARVQALPATTAEGSGDLALSTPPVVQLRGRSRLARPGESSRPAAAALEMAAARAAGPDGWWLSFWEADDWLYWALVPPGSGEISSGRRRIRAGSELGRALADLEEALPLLRSGEDPASADFRIAGSPLLTDPDAEQVLSARLGSLLLPAALIHAARGCDDRGLRLSLAIVPSPSLGYAPWGILAVPRGDGGFDRMLELCDWTIAPSAALLIGAPAGARSGKKVPLALAVADTVASDELWPLEGARQQAGALPPAVSVLGGPHWTGRTATVEAVSRELEDAGPDITAAFLCHAVRGTAEEPSRGGLVMAAEELEVLSPVDLFAMSERGVEMPAQVLLQACDTSALSDAASGEWLTLPPALIAGGSREVIATLYPMPDLYVPDDPVIAAAIAGTSLREAVVLHQRVGLIRWEAGKASDPSHTPLAWAAYAPICVGPPPSPAGEDRKLAGDEAVSARFVRLVEDAIKQCQEGRAERFDSGYLLAAVLDDSEINFYFDGGGHSFTPLTFLWTLGPYLCSRFLRFRDGATRELALDDGTRIQVSEVMFDSLAAARLMAARDGVLIEPEYLLQVVLERRSGARRILRLLSVLSRRPVELTVRAIAHNLADTIARGQKPAGKAPRWASEQERLARAFAGSATAAEAVA